MTIYFSRDSVCMGDDCFDNSREIDFPDDASLEAVIPRLQSERFLAKVAGNDVVWVLEDHRGREVLAYYTLFCEICPLTAERSLAALSGWRGRFPRRKGTMHFRYYTSPRQRRAVLERRGHWDDGEYAFCKSIDGDQFDS